MGSKLASTLLSILLLCSAAVPSTPDSLRTPPPPPQAGFHYFGWGGDSAQRKAFLYNRETVYIVEKDDLISDRGTKYKVQEISDSLVVLLVVKTKEQARLRLESVQISERSKFGKVTQGPASGSKPGQAATPTVIAQKEPPPSSEPSPPASPPPPEEQPLFSDWGAESSPDSAGKPFQTAGEDTGWLLVQPDEANWGGDFFFGEDSSGAPPDSTQQPSGPVQMRVFPHSQPVTTGSDFRVDISIQNAQDVYSIQITLTVDPKSIELVGVTEGPFLNSDGKDTSFDPMIDSPSGRLTVSLTRVGSVPGISGAGTVFSANMRAQAPGMTSVSLGEMLVRNSQGAALSATGYSGTVVIRK